MPAGVTFGSRLPPPERRFARCTARFTGGEFQHGPASWWMERQLARRLLGLSSAEVAGTVVPIASTRVSRLLGLALLDRESAGSGLLIPRCRSVHTFGMRFDLDLVFIDEAGLIIRVANCVPPARMLFERSADGVLEVPSNGAALSPGAG